MKRYSFVAKIGWLGLTAKGYQIFFSFLTKIIMFAVLILLFTFYDRVCRDSLFSLRTKLKQKSVISTKSVRLLFPG
jgi:hypothetical protein